jgi:hypothetical protein
VTYYLCRLFDGNESLWEIRGRVAKRVYGAVYIDRFEAQPGETIWDAIRARTGWFEPPGFEPFHRFGLAPGQYHPFIARPSDMGASGDTWCPSELFADDSLARSRGQLLALTRTLSEICQTVHPASENLRVFGHEIRNLLILASTEVEAHWTKVMRANGVTKSRLNRADYVRLATPMGLRDFAVDFPRFPWLSAVRPFAGWGRGGRLKWYDAYNHVKHDREAHFKEATLGHAFSAVVACVVMVEAQFGANKALLPGSDLPSFFRFSARPDWPISKFYLSDQGGGWQEVWEPNVRG